MADSLDLSRIDPLPGQSARTAVAPSRPRDRQPQKRRPPDQPRRDEDPDDEPKQVGSRLDVRV